MIMYDFSKPLKIGTRGSKLALVQTNIVSEKLKEKFPDLKIEIVKIRTSGDWKKSDGEKRLPENTGGKGLFLKEIEQHILDGKIDCGVHSMKDVPCILESALGVDHVLERADPRDAFISNIASEAKDLPNGATIGTASLRRQAILLKERPDLKPAILRGNVDTRLAKLDDGQVDATILAVCGLERIGRSDRITKRLSIEEMLPACGQGVLTIQTRKKDIATRSLLDAIHHQETGLCSIAERAALEALGAGCHTPVGSYASMEGSEMRLRVTVYEEDGSAFYEEDQMQIIKTEQQAHEFGFAIGQKIKPLAPQKLFA